MQTGLVWEQLELDFRKVPAESMGPIDFWPTGIITSGKDCDSVWVTCDLCDLRKNTTPLEMRQKMCAHLSMDIYNQIYETWPVASSTEWIRWQVAPAPLASHSGVNILETVLMQSLVLSSASKQ